MEGNTIKITNVYCPICEKRYGRQKLLFKIKENTHGAIIIKCRGCREDVEVDIDNKRAIEPRVDQ